MFKMQKKSGALFFLGARLVAERGAPRPSLRPVAGAGAASPPVVQAERREGRHGPAPQRSFMGKAPSAYAPTEACA